MKKNGEKMTHTYRMDRQQSARLTEAVARHYGSIDSLALRADDESKTITAYVNGRDVAIVNYTEESADPVQRLLDLRAAYFNGGRDGVTLDEVMSLLEPAYQKLSSGG